MTSRYPHVAEVVQTWPQGRLERVDKALARREERLADALLQDAGLIDTVCHQQDSVRDPAFWTALLQDAFPAQYRFFETTRVTAEMKRWYDEVYPAMGGRNTVYNFEKWLFVELQRLTKRLSWKEILILEKLQEKAHDLPLDDFSAFANRYPTLTLVLASRLDDEPAALDPHLRGLGRHSGEIEHDPVGVLGLEQVGEHRLREFPKRVPQCCHSLR